MKTKLPSISNDTLAIVALAVWGLAIAGWTVAGVMYWFIEYAHRHIPAEYWS